MNASLFTPVCWLFWLVSCTCFGQDTTTRKEPSLLAKYVNVSGGLNAHAGFFYTANAIESTAILPVVQVMYLANNWRLMS
ncbi:MAG: hypothetical protein EOO39_05750 [Cytophagaceae bacterium]|nr:MAG: hypothetical protein EOO39_05750 [Cytophagaceae bacterium]